MWIDNTAHAVKVVDSFMNWNQQLILQLYVFQVAIKHIAKDKVSDWGQVC